MAALILIAFIVACLLIDAAVQYYGRKNSAQTESSKVFERVFDSSRVSSPKGLYFDKTHTWAFMEKNGTLRTGIDDFVPRVTGKITGIQMKEPGEIVKKGKTAFSIIQNGKKLDINSPVSGIVKANNQLLKEESSKLNYSPYDSGWVYEVEPTNWLREMNFLINESEYKLWLKNEFNRLKEFFLGSIPKNKLELSPIIMQDGGEIKENVLEEYGPEIWEDFQVNFMNNSK